MKDSRPRGSFFVGGQYREGQTSRLPLAVPGKACRRLDRGTQELSVLFTSRERSERRATRQSK